VNLPSWYGVGAALANWVEGDDSTGDADEKNGSENRGTKNGVTEESAKRLTQLSEMYQNWPFFRTVLDNVQMGLCKGDMPIASLYAELTDSATREEVFTDLHAEYERTKKMVLAITGYTELLENESWLQRSIKLRNPYVDPMNYIQVAVLEKLRDQPEAPDASELQAAVLLSVNGVAAGLQNTG
jgi:phosphoenolpyruvate carboxylase